MAYELVIRTREAATDAQRAALRSALQQAGAVGLRKWLESPAPVEGDVAPLEPGATVAIANGGALLEARVVELESGIAGADMVIKSGGTEEEFRDALKLALTLADRSGSLVYDPQLARELAGSNTEGVVESWRKMQTWTLELTGLAEDPRGIPTSYVTETPTGGRKLVIFAAVLVLLFLFLRAIGSGGVEVIDPADSPVQRIPQNLVPPPPQLQQPSP